MTSTCVHFSAWRYDTPDGPFWAWSCSCGENHQGFPNLARVFEDASQRVHSTCAVDGKQRCPQGTPECDWPVCGRAFHKGFHNDTASASDQGSQSDREQSQSQEAR